MSKLDALGLVAGTSHRPTTFNNNGLLLTGSPLREVWSHIEPTLIGQIAALVRRLRDPYFVRALQERISRQYTIADHFGDWVSMQLAVIYGDSATVTHIQREVDIDRRKPYWPSGHPAWFRRATGNSHRSFTFAEPNLVREQAHTTVAAMARAHAAADLLNDDNFSSYCASIQHTLGWLFDVTLWPDGTPTNLTTLNNLNDRRDDVTLMNAQAVIRSGAHDLLMELLASEFTPGVPLSHYAHVIGGLIQREDRETFEFPWSFKQDDKFAAWCSSYQEGLARPRFKVSLRDA